MKLLLKNSLLWLLVALAVLPLRATEPATAVIEENTAPVPPAATVSEAIVIPEQAPAPAVEAAKPVEQSVEKKQTKKPHGRHKKSDDGLVGIGHGVSLAADEKADEVVSILGSASSAGTVGDSVVSLFGNTCVTGGNVGDEAVAILGNVYVNGHVRGGVVAILGNVDLGPDAVVDGEIVCIGGKVTKSEQATWNGPVQDLSLGDSGVDFSGLSVWFNECLLKARLLAYDSRVLWAWIVAFGFLAGYTFIALLVPGPVRQCVQTLEEQPGKSMLTAVLVMVLTPMAYLLLVITIFIGVGLVLIPLFSFGLLVLGVFGKLVVLAWLGRRLTGAAKEGIFSHPAVTVLIGGLVALALYSMPWFGLIFYKLLGVVGLGVVIYTLIRAAKANRSPVMPAAGNSGVGQPGFSPEAGAMGTALTTLPPVISAATLPRAGFWLRLAAALLDVVLVGIVSVMLSALGGGFPLWLAVYSVVMWATKGTTIGGSICGLKVVRLDDRPVDWGVAAVRGLAGFLSLVVAGLGFIWVACDDERQSWHDKIAGTTIVRVPKGTSLL